MFHSLIEIKELIIELVFFNSFELFVKLELFKSSYFSSKRYFVPLIRIHKNSYKRFRERNLYIFQSPNVKLKLETVGDMF